MALDYEDYFKKRKNFKKKNFFTIINQQVNTLHNFNKILIKLTYTHKVYCT